MLFSLSAQTGPRLTYSGSMTMQNDRVFYKYNAAKNQFCWLFPWKCLLQFCPALASFHQPASEATVL